VQGASLCLGVVSFLLMSLLVAGAYAAPAGAGTVESGLSLADSLRQSASSRSNRTLARDEKLDSVARWIAMSLFDGPVDRTAVRHRLWREGIVDFEFSPMSIVLPAGSTARPQEALAPVFADSSMPWQRYNTLAVATARSDDGRTAVAMLFLRRIARIRKGGADGRSSARLQVTLPGDYRDPTLFITVPEGVVISRSGEQRGSDTWEFDARATDGQGSSLLEIVADGPRGPEVLLLWSRSKSKNRSSLLRKPRHRTVVPGSSAPLAHNPYLKRRAPAGASDSVAPPRPKLPVAADAAAWVVGARPGPPRSPQPADVALAEEHLWGLVQSTRQSRGLVRLRRVAGLTRAARRHAGDLGRGEAFGHETSSGNAMTRLEDEGVTALRATENVAVAANVAEAHAALMASPSHRSNLLDPQVSAGGVGVVLKRDAKGRWAAVVSELFAQLLADGPGDQWQAAILNRVNDRRQVAGIAKLKKRDRLSELSVETSRLVIESGVARLNTEERRAIAEKARFHFLNVRRVGVDLLVTADPQGVDRISHSLESSFTEVGVGVVRLREPMGPHAAGALVITLIFIER